LEHGPELPEPPSSAKDERDREESEEDHEDVLEGMYAPRIMKMYLKEVTGSGARRRNSQLIMLK
jgi:hypothetical protein